MFLFDQKPRLVGMFSETGPVTGATVKTARLSFSSIHDELRFLRKVVKHWRGKAWTREMATRIVFEDAGCEPRDRLCHAVAVTEWVKQAITYVNELPETFQTPERTVEFGYGDCDDFTTLIASMLESIGIPVAIVGMKVDGRWRHVYPVASIRLRDGRTVAVPLDATIPDEDVRSFPDPAARTRARGRQVTLYNE